MRCGRRWGALAALLLAGCGKQGTVTFTIEAPADPKLSPLADTRREQMVISDEQTGTTLGATVSARMDAPCPDAMDPGVSCLGPIPVGTYDLKLSVTGAAQLLGMARHRRVEIAGDADAVVALHLRKPLAYLGVERAFPPMGMLPPPDPLGVIDTTLPANPVLAPIATPGPAAASATLSDGTAVIAGAGTQLVAIDTATHQLVRSITLGGTILDVAVAPDDHAAAVVTDQGLAVLADVAAFVGGGGTAPQVAPLPKLRRVAWSPDGARIAAVAGPAWDEVDCTNGALASTLTLVEAAAPTQLGAARPIAKVATDVAWDQAHGLMLALPCGDGVVAVNPDSGAVGATVVPGAMVFDVVVSGGAVLAVEGKFVQRQVAVDPFDPSLRNVKLPFAHVASTAGASEFAVPPDRIAINSPAPDGSVAQVRLTPVSLAAYDAAASSDGVHLLFAGRTTYQASHNRFINLVQGNQPFFFCELNAIEDVYRVLEVDLSSGTVGYQPVTAIDDKKCEVDCFDCGQFGLCPANPTQVIPCAVTDGYVPGGLSVLMGSR